MQTIQNWPYLTGVPGETPGHSEAANAGKGVSRLSRQHWGKSHAECSEAFILTSKTLVIIQREMSPKEVRYDNQNFLSQLRTFNIVFQLTIKHCFCITEMTGVCSTP